MRLVGLALDQMLDHMLNYMLDYLIGRIIIDFVNMTL